MASERIGLEETKKWDAVGIGLSMLCAVHCVSVPILLSVLPMTGLGFVANHEFEWVMMGIIFVVAGVTFVRGYRRHRNRGVFVFFALGLVIFLFVRPFVPEDWHPFATIAGGLAFIAGHWKNWHWHRPTCRKPCCTPKG